MSFLSLLLISHLKNLLFSATQTKLMVILLIFQLCSWLWHNLCQLLVYFLICSVLISPALLSLLRSCHYSSAGFLRPSPPLQFIPSLVPQYADIYTGPGSFAPRQTTLVLPACPSSDLFVWCPGFEPCLLDVSKLNYLLDCLLLCCAFGFFTVTQRRHRLGCTLDSQECQFETSLMNQHILIITNTTANCKQLLSQQRSQHLSYQHVPNLHRTPVVWLGFG